MDDRQWQDRIEQARHVSLLQWIGGRVAFRAEGSGRHVGLCPFHQEKTPSFHIFPDNHFHCYGCGAHGNNAIDYVMASERVAFTDAIERLVGAPPPPPQNQPPPPLRWSPDAERIWRRTDPLAGTLGAVYFGWRSCALPQGEDVRFAAKVVHWPSSTAHPAIVSRITDLVTGDPMSLHFVFLAADGRGKADVQTPKLYLRGHAKAGGVIRLTDNAAATTRLAFAEGLETALAVAPATDPEPVWSALDAGNLGELPTVAGIEDLTIYADAGEAGEGKARKLAGRWHQAGRQVTLCVAPRDDWNTGANGTNPYRAPSAAELDAARQPFVADREPPKPAAGAAGDDWEEPDMGILYERPAAPPFPAALLDGELASLISDMADATMAPVDYCFGALLAAMAGAIGNRRTLVAHGWTEPSILWVSLIGEPGVSKSPAMAPIVQALHAVEQARNVDYQRRCEEHELEAERASLARQQWQKEHLAARKNKKPDVPFPDDARAPPAPQRHVVIIIDATMEKIARIAAGNPGGQIVVRDELSGLFDSLNAYRGGHGADRSFLLQAYNGASYRVDRVGSDPIFIPHLSLSLCGGIQPDNLGRLLKDLDDGLLARMAMIWPDPVPLRPSRRDIDHDKLAMMLGRLHALEFDSGHDGTPRPRSMMAEHEAVVHVIALQDALFAAYRDKGDPAFRGFVAKARGFTMRLALILAHVPYVLARTQETPRTISVADVAVAGQLFADYFVPMAERCYGEAVLPMEMGDAARIARWLLRTQPDRVNARLLRRGIPEAPHFQKDSARVDAALLMLVDHGWLRQNGRQTGGRPRKDYTVHPRMASLTHKLTGPGQKG